MTLPDGVEGEIVDVHCGWGATTAAPGWGDARQVRTALQARGVRAAFLASDLARRFDPAAGNEQVAEAATLCPELYGWLVVHPARHADAHALMRRFLYSERFVGCALYPEPLSDNLITLRGARDVLNACRRFGKPLLIEALTGQAMLHVAEIAREMPSMKLIASGMGGADWREAVDLAVPFVNLFLDISGALYPEKLDYAVSTLNGVRKLLFGSGAPRTDPAAIRGLLDDIGLSEEDRARVLGGNATRLFSLDGSPDGGGDLRSL